MALTNLTLTIGRATSANGQGQLPHGALFQQIIAASVRSTISAPTNSGNGGFFLYRVRSTVDAFVSISKTPETTAAWFVAANTDYDFWAIGGDFLYWVAA